MNLNDIGATEKQLLIFFENVKKHVHSLNVATHEFKSRKYPTLRILYHKGYVYVWEYDAAKQIKKQIGQRELSIDGFRCMPSKDAVNLMYVEIHANGGDTYLANPESFEIDLPENVLCFLLDSLKPDFLKYDVYALVF